MTTTFEHDSKGRVYVYRSGICVDPRLSVVEAHDRYGMTLLDCVACESGEPTVHAFEARQPVRTHFVVQSTHDFQPHEDYPLNPYCQRSGGQGACGLPASNRHHTAIVRVEDAPPLRRR